MSWTFRKTFSLGRLLRINVSKRGLGVSVGVPGFRVGLGADGKVRRTISIPGTGLRATEVIGGEAKGHRGRGKVCPACGAGNRRGARYCDQCGAAID